ncbi:MAG: pentapeptide repeat-containing protein [Flavobacteriales bacterium]|nr:pentapeptide repeat-containing protein [Flavobacteriales bacterium]
MKRLIIRIFVVLVCLVVGFALGYLRLPYIDEKYNFWIGFVTASAIVLCYFLLNKVGSKLWISNPKKWAVVGLIAFSALFITLLTKNKMLQLNAQQSEKRATDLQAISDSITSQNQAVILNEIINQLRLESGNGKIISDHAIERISALTATLKPSRQFDGDSLTEKSYSPEKGQLLLAILMMNLDSNSFKKIKQKVSFAQAYLPRANLQKMDLSGIDLSNSYLKSAEMDEVNLSGSNLKEANIWGANLRQSVFDSSNMNRCILSWSNLEYSSLIGCNMNAAESENTNFTFSNVSLAKASFSNLNYSNFSYAQLKGANLDWSKLKMVNFDKTDLSSSSIINADISHSNIFSAILNEIQVNKSWLEDLCKWEISNSEQIQQEYQIRTDSSGPEKERLFKYFLVPKTFQ